MKLATFDIFDTALIRRCGMPSVVFNLVAVKLFPDDEILQTEYLNLRRQGAQMAGRNATLEQIYAVEGMEDFPGFSVADIMEAELAVEAGQLTVNPAIASEISCLRAEGWTIKFLSDMYLPSVFLKDVLVREGVALEEDEVIVSCEWGARKDDGTLYQAVRRKFSPAQWRHCGDNERSDVRMARKNGVDAVVAHTGFSAVERRVMAAGAGMRSGWQMSLLAGASRMARLKNPAAAVTLAADYVAAAYIPFVVWVLRCAERQGIGRLHFLSRDGYVMIKIAEALEPAVELNYLFVSRKALMQAYLSESTAERYLEISDRKTIVGRYVDNLLSQLQLSREQLAEAGVKFDFNHISNKERQKEFLDKLFRNPEYTPTLMTGYAENAIFTKKYLVQEGLTDGSRQAMVDIGWLGTSRLMVNRILGTDIPTLYLGVRGDVYPRSCGDYDSYFPTGQLSTEATGHIENYFSASPWPSTIGYCENESGEIAPRFAGGHAYAETEVTRANVKVACAMASYLRPYLQLIDDETLYRWAKISIESIAEMKDDIDLSPMTHGGDFDGIPMISKLSAKALCDVVLLGAHHTAFDRGSLCHTLGNRLGRSCWKIHQRSTRLRSAIYRRFLCKAQ